MSEYLVKPLRVAALAVWLGVLVAYGLAPNPTAVLTAGACQNNGCRSCQPGACCYCAYQPLSGGYCLDKCI
jgi:hypothetical protein